MINKVATGKLILLQARNTEMAEMEEEKLFIGFDLSTQQVV